MKAYVILLRGINVGGKNLLAMQDLKSLLINEGYEQVKTYIQTGNAVFKAGKKPDNSLAIKIEQSFGFRPEILVMDKKALEKSIENNPYKNQQGKTVHFYFCTQAPKLNYEKIATLKADDEEYQLVGNVFYLHAPRGIGRSRLVAKIESCLGVAATGRNLNTMGKIEDMLQTI